jgi:hypothetical protein
MAKLFKAERLRAALDVDDQPVFGLTQTHSKRLRIVLQVPAPIPPTNQSLRFGNPFVVATLPVPAG